MTNEQALHILTRLEIGFRTDAVRLAELELDLRQALQRARRFGREHGSPEDWNTIWHQEWEKVESALGSIRAQVNELRGCVESDQPDRFDKALESWQALQAEDAKLMAGLRAIRGQVNGLEAAFRRDWNILARTLEPQLEVTHACGQALRIKLELLKRHSKAEVDRVVREVLDRLPKRTSIAAAEDSSYEREYQQAFAELQREHHKYLGFMDVVTALLLLVETPEERVSKHRSLRVDEA